MPWRGCSPTPATRNPRVGTVACAPARSRGAGTSTVIVSSSGGDAGALSACCWSPGCQPAMDGVSCAPAGAADRIAQATGSSARRTRRARPRPWARISCIPRLRCTCAGSSHHDRCGHPGRDARKQPHAPADGRHRRVANVVPLSGRLPCPEIFSRRAGSPWRCFRDRARGTTARWIAAAPSRLDVVCPMPLRRAPGDALFVGLRVASASVVAGGCALPRRLSVSGAAGIGPRSR